MTGHRFDRQSSRAGLEQLRGRPAALCCGEVGPQPASVDGTPVFEATMAREEQQVAGTHCHRIAADCRMRRRKCNVCPWAHRLDRDRVIASSNRRAHGRVGSAVAWKLTTFEEHVLKTARNHQGEEPSPAGCSVDLRRRTYANALRDGSLSLAGPPALTRNFMTWFRTSPFAPYDEARH